MFDLFNGTEKQQKKIIIRPILNLRKSFSAYAAWAMAFAITINVPVVFMARY
jgi:hypothetical protein